MDRTTQYFGALVPETDPLRMQQNTMVGLAYTAQAFLGTATAVDGFGLAPTTPASLVANLAPGAVYQLENLEATTWSSLPANTATSIVKQGLMQSVDPITFTPPATTGYSQAFLVEVQYADLDTSPVLLPYYNATNPAVPYSGPGNNGQSQNTARLGIVAVQVKAGIAATSGTQVTPTPDAGWVGLYVVTLAAGSSTVTAGNIATYAGAPFLPVKLPGVPAGVQSGAWVYGAASGTNTYTATLFSTSAYPYARTVGMEILVYVANANTTTTPTLAENGQTGAQIRKQGGGAPAVGDISGFVPLIWDGTYWRVNGLVPSDVLALIQSTAIVPATAPVTVYTDSTSGSDTTGTGSNTAPFATNAKGYSYLAGRFSFGTFSATIQMLTAGTYDLPVGFTAVPNLSLIGNHANPAAYILTGAAPSGSTYCCAVSGCTVMLDGVTVNNTTPTKNTLGSVSNGSLTLGNVNLTATSTLTAAHLSAGQGGSAGISGNVAVQQSAAQLLYATGGNIAVFGTITVPSGGSFSDAVVVADHGYVAIANGASSFSGTTSGKRFRENNQAYINTFGQSTSFIPGSIAGTVDSTCTYA